MASAQVGTGNLGIARADMIRVCLKETDTINVLQVRFLSVVHLPLCLNEVFLNE